MLQQLPNTNLYIVVYPLLSTNKTILLQLLDEECNKIRGHGQLLPLDLMQNGKILGQVL